MDSPPDIFDRGERIHAAQKILQSSSIEALVITPGSNLLYLTGYRGNAASERLTCLLVPQTGPCTIIVPRLEAELAAGSIAQNVEAELRIWDENDDPLAVLANMIDHNANRIALDEQMWAGRAIRLAELHSARQINAASLTNRLRLRKNAAECDALRSAAHAIDSVHRHMAEWLRPGRTEREVGRDIADAIVQAGHLRAEFVIVASGANAASPHAEVSDKKIVPDEPIVVDIGGVMSTGYNSDSTRTYFIGQPQVRFAEYFSVLLKAQAAQCEFVQPGVSANSLDAVGRQIISDAGFGQQFFHRTGHGIGLDVHEEPYIVDGNLMTLEKNMAFSIEPGIYFPRRDGARIEDIVLCGASGGERLNRTSRDLRIL